ncbi:uncharacterized protein LOC111257985 [Setaria italica]|uniref:uncharacterized protein LOC111257985 n=1 Tax=Setaria italica TaxID=4555 RepID=UPI000BE5618C|nr:uncharacterized protein LOC111257985 [Setaria italica]
MLQEVICSVEDPSTASGSGNVSLSVYTGGALAVGDVEKSKEPTAPGTSLGAAPHLAKSTQGLVLGLPSESEFQRAVDVFRSFQELYDQTQRNTRALQERNEQLEQECARLTESLKVHEVGAKSFDVERSDHEVLQQKLESRYKSLNKKYQELKRKETVASSQLLDWRNAHDRVADEAEHLRASLMEAQAACEHQRDRKIQNRVPPVVVGRPERPCDIVKA